MKNCRNWWVEARVDGRESAVSFGPRAADGGFTLRVYQRAGGESVLAAVVVGQVRLDGVLVLSAEGFGVQLSDGSVMADLLGAPFSVHTKR